MVGQLLSGILGGYILFVILSCIIPPLFQKKPDTQGETMASESSEHIRGNHSERIRCIDDNEEALFWRFQIIDSAKQEIIYSTFDYRADHSGTDILSFLYQVAKRGVQIRLIVDGLISIPAVFFNRYFRLLRSMPNVTVKLYNPVNLFRPWRLNYRLHDKYIIVDHEMYLLGGRNTNDLFLGKYRPSQNVDRELFVCAEIKNIFSSMEQLQQYFDQIWKLKCCKTVRTLHSSSLRIIEAIEHRYSNIKASMPERFEQWDYVSETFRVESVSLLSNPIRPENKKPQLWYSLR